MSCTLAIVTILLKTATASVKCSEGTVYRNVPVVIGKADTAANTTPTGTYAISEVYPDKIGKHYVFAPCLADLNCRGSNYEIHSTLPKSYGQGSEAQQLSGDRRKSLGCVRFPARIFSKIASIKAITLRN